MEETVARDRREFVDLLDYDVACQVEEQMLRFFPMSNILGKTIVSTSPNNVLLYLTRCGLH